MRLSCNYFKIKKIKKLVGENVRFYVFAYFFLGQYIKLSFIKCCII